MYLGKRGEELHRLYIAVNDKLKQDVLDTKVVGRMFSGSDCFVAVVKVR